MRTHSASPLLGSPVTTAHLAGPGPKPPGTLPPEQQQQQTPGSAEGSCRHAAAAAAAALLP
jgi:hypothetical protein